MPERWGCGADGCEAGSGVTSLAAPLVDSRAAVEMHQEIFRNRGWSEAEGGIEASALKKYG